MSTFQEVATGYLAHSKSRVKPSTARAELSCISRILEHGGFADKDCSSIGCLIVESYQNARLDSGVQASTVNTEVAVMSKVMSFAVKGGFVPINPCAIVKKLNTKKPERRFLTNEEIAQLCEKCSPSLFDYLKFLQYTGAREQEALKVRWSDVDFKARKICIGADGDTKNGRSRCVEFSEALRAHLETMFNNLGENVFLFPKFSAGHVKSFRDQFDSAKKRVGLERVGFHDFRRHFVSQCVMSGIDFATIAKWIGHSDGGALLAKKYAFLANDYMVKQAAKLKF